MSNRTYTNEGIPCWVKAEEDQEKWRQAVRSMQACSETYKWLMSVYDVSLRELEMSFDRATTPPDWITDEEDIKRSLDLVKALAFQQETLCKLANTYHVAADELLEDTGVSLRAGVGFPEFVFQMG